MGFSFLMRVWALVPKWLIIGLVACGFAYLAGVSHGRGENKIAVAVQNVVIKREVELRTKAAKAAVKLRKKSYEDFKNFDWSIDAVTAGKLSDIGTD